MKIKLRIFVIFVIFGMSCSSRRDKVDIVLNKVVSNYPRQEYLGYASPPRVDLVLKVVNKSDEILAIPTISRFDSELSMFKLKILTTCRDTLFANLYGLTGVKYVLVKPKESKPIVLTTYFRELKKMNLVCDSSYIGFFLKQIGEEGEIEFFRTNKSVSIKGRSYTLPKKINFYRAHNFQYEAPVKPVDE